MNAIRRIFTHDYERYEGVRPVNIYLLRAFFLLIFLFVGSDSWSYIIRHEGSWDPMRAAAWCMFASYSLLSGIGVFRPLKMLPILLFVIAYKSLWLAAVAYPLWMSNQLAGSSAEAMTAVFMWTPLLMVAVPWGYVFRTYLLPESAVSRRMRLPKQPRVAQ